MKNKIEFFDNYIEFIGFDNLNVERPAAIISNETAVTICSDKDKETPYRIIFDVSNVSGRKITQNRAVRNLFKKLNIDKTIFLEVEPGNYIQGHPTHPTKERIALV